MKYSLLSPEDVLEDPSRLSHDSECVERDVLDYF